MSRNGKEAATLPERSSAIRAGRADFPGFWQSVALFTLLAVAYQVVTHFLNYRDYIGPDPDDSMRLVQVRDFLAGQGWFDLTQYRLGPEGGTLMHWSRLVDLPIAGLILFFSLFMAPASAEAAAALVWPVLLILPLMASMALAGYRMGGRQAMVMALGLALIFTCAITRFSPGGLDHHNVQLVLAIFIAAMMIDPLARAGSFAAAAIAGALALAVGAETTPLVAVSAITTAVLWGRYGTRYRRAAIAYGIAFAIASAVLFFGTVPPALYSYVTCDTLSVGFASLAALGGFGLTAAAAGLSTSATPMRYLSLAGVGVVVAIAAVLIAPQCLGNPLSSLDPLLKTMWLGSITEAQSIVSEMTANPSLIGGLYAVGLIAVAVCLARIHRGQRVVQHAIMAALIGVSWLVAAVQVRGMIFANFLAFVPLSALIADLRDHYLRHRKDSRAAVAFVLSVLASVPSVWTVAGVLVAEAGSAVAGDRDERKKAARKDDACTSGDNLKPLADLLPGRILSTANPGSALLRFTPHSVLTANYHRNQKGMVAALEIGMASPENAYRMILDQNVAYVLVCNDDPQVKMMVKNHPDGFFARLADGEIPEFLMPLPHQAGDTFKLFRVLS